MKKLRRAKQSVSRSVIVVAKVDSLRYHPNIVFDFGVYLSSPFFVEP